MSPSTGIRALLIDISGTLLIGSSAIHGSADALSKLRAAGIPFRFCSNTSKESSDAVHKRMLAAGLNVHRAEVWTSIGALKAVLKRLQVNRPYMLLTSSAIEECMDGFENDSGAIAASSSSTYDAVVVGLAPALLDYAHLNTAFRILTGENPSNAPPASTSCGTASGSNMPSSFSSESALQFRSRRRSHSRPPPLIALHKARYIEASDHALSLGPGPFVLALEEAAQISATVVGKPTRAFFETVLHDLERDLDDDAEFKGHNNNDEKTVASDSSPNGTPHEEIAVIGDDVHADLGEGAIELGLWRVLVQTGKYRSGDQGRSKLPPDQVCASFAEFVEDLLEQRARCSMALKTVPKPVPETVR